MEETNNLVNLRLLTNNARLVAGRKALGLTQTEFARLTGINVAKLSGIENLRILPSFDIKDTMASALGFTTDYLFPESLLKAIDAGVFSKRHRALEEVEIVALTEARLDQLAYTDDDMLESIDRSILKEQINEVLNRLTPREQRVIDIRFGLTDGDSHTLRETGVKFNVTQERIRQIEAKALRKLRHPEYSRKLKMFLE